MWLISYEKNNYLTLFLSKKSHSTKVDATLNIFEDRINVFFKRMKYTLGQNKIIITCNENLYQVYYLNNTLDKEYQSFLREERTILWYLKYRFKKSKILPTLIFKTFDIDKLVYIVKYMKKKEYIFEYKNLEPRLIKEIEIE